MSLLGRLGLGLGLGLGLVAATLALPAPTLAAAPQVALVVGNGTYSSLPVLSACPLSAHAVSAALRRIGYDVVEREDTSSGGMDAAISDFAGRLTPDSEAVVYACGYATAFNQRAFLLPVSAMIARPTDVLTQGLLARTLLDVVARANPAAALVALDAVPMPGGPTGLALDTLTSSGPLPDGVALIAATEAKPAANPTPLASALVAGLAGPEVVTSTLLAGLQQQLTAAGPAVAIAALQPALRPSYLAGTPPRPPVAVATPAPQPPASPPAVPPAATPALALPAEAGMTEAQRREVQIALAKLGYYDGRLDAVFGPDTRAAIRRYQHELHADMTGTLTAEQATRLVRGP
ncbi:MAG TPA: peptidoglycan-binding protein [Acetobacteraceae bacterium]|nr:peptidoglycan-binding protein [Acetobacteraceae bacterium]